MRKISFMLGLLFLLQLGASAPRKSSNSLPSTPPVPKGTKAPNAVASAATPQALGDQIVRFFGRKTGKELMMEKAQSKAGAAKAGMKAAPTAAKTTTGKVAIKGAVTGKPMVQKANAVPLKPGYVPPPPVPRTSVDQVRQEIQKILDLNKKIKTMQSGRTIQFQRVQEQARIHQKILNELEASQKQANGQKVSAKSALLAQEKLRIIHEETQRNASTVKDLKEAPAAKASNTADKVKNVAS